MKASILISSHNRLHLFKRTLWAIANRGPSIPFEVIVVDDDSTENVLGELKLWSSRFFWKFIKFNSKIFEEQTGLKKFLNNPCVTNNIAFKHSVGDLIFQQGNEVIPYEKCYDELIADAPKDEKHFMVMSTTFDVPQYILNALDQYGSNLNSSHVAECLRWPLQSIHYRSDVTNYISLASRSLWNALNGYDERYYGGISAEDSDFVRRARLLPNFQQMISSAVSLHQYHGGKTTYYNPPPKYCTQERWAEGCAINHAIYHNFDGTAKNHTPWKWGELGVGEIITNG